MNPIIGKKLIAITHNNVDVGFLFSAKIIITEKTKFNIKIIPYAEKKLTTLSMLKNGVNTLPPTYFF